MLLDERLLWNSSCWWHRFESQVCSKANLFSTSCCWSHLMASGLKPTGTKICARLIFEKKQLIGHCVPSCPDLPPSFLKEVQSFVKVLFTAGQAILQSHDHDAFDNDNNGVDNHNVVNKFKISVLTNAVCVDILVWAARDEQGRTQPTSDPSSKSWSMLLPQDILLTAWGKLNLRKGYWMLIFN